MLHRSSVLSTLGAAASLLIFSLVLSTYFVVAMANVFRAPPAHPETAIPTWAISIGDGLVTLGHWNIPANAPPPAAGTFSPGTDWSFTFRPILPSTIPDAVWGFRSYTQPLTGRGLTVSWLSAPVWPLLVASAIPPTLWYRRRLKARAQGFAVETTAST